VVRQGRIELLEELGFANVEHQVSVSKDSVFSVNSMSKAFTGVAVMQLVEAGELDLSAPVSTYLKDLPEHWRSITVRQLATLTSGVPEMMAYTADNDVALLGDGTEEGAWQAAYGLPMEYPTGRGYAYTQTNYALLGRIIQHLSGKTFGEFVAEHQFGVAGMANTRFATDQDIVPNRADTYMNINAHGDSAGRVFRSHLNWPAVLHPAAGLHSTAEDLAKWLIALQGGKLLKEKSSLETLWARNALPDGRPGIWGIGWIIGQSSAGRVPAPGGGAKAQMAIYPEGLAIVLLTNLLGAFREHLAVPEGQTVDLAFIDPIAACFAPELIRA
jgi:CubicO group peptidase (beta-lactamase class C family)